jgi:Tfp pilus assembly protein PilO
VINRIRSSRRASALTVALVIALLAAAAWFAVVAPKRNDAAKLKSDVADAQVKLAEATQSSAKMKRETAAATLRALPSDADQPGLLDQLNTLGKKSKVVVTTVTPALTTTTPGALSLSITVTGSYFHVRDFLHNLRSQVRFGKNGRVVANGRLFDVQSVNLQQSSGASTLTAQLALTAGIFAPPAPAPAAGTTTTSASATGAGTTN